MLLPTYNEDPYRIMARLRAMYELVDQAGSGASFDWFVLSDTTDPAIWIAEEKSFSASPGSRGWRTSTTVTAGTIPPRNPATSKTGSSGSAQVMII